MTGYRGCLGAGTIWMAFSGLIALAAAPGDGVFTFVVIAVLGWVVLALVFGLWRAMRFGAMAGTAARKLVEDRSATSSLDDEVAALGGLGRAGADSVNPAPNRSNVRPRIRPGENGAWATFTYTDRRGRITERRISDWKSEAYFVNGICSLSNSERTFDKLRIADWRAG